MLRKVCPLCNEQVPLSFYDRHVFRERSMIRRMKEDHPESENGGETSAEFLSEYKRTHDSLVQESRQLRHARGEIYETIDEEFESDYDEYAAKSSFSSFEPEREGEDGNKDADAGRDQISLSSPKE